MSARPRIGLIVGSTRPSRIGRKVADEIVPAIEAAGAEPVMLDLAEIDLPLLNEEAHPATGIRTEPHTIAWAEQIEALDGVILLTPEYNGSFSAPIKNALDSLYTTWKDMPGLVVSYGWSGGAGASAGIGGVFAHMGGVLAAEGVKLTFAPTDFDEDRTFGEVAPFVARFSDDLRQGVEQLVAAASAELVSA